MANVNYLKIYYPYVLFIYYILLNTDILRIVEKLKFDFIEMRYFCNIKSHCKLVYLKKKCNCNTTFLCFKLLSCCM